MVTKQHTINLISTIDEPMVTKQHTINLISTIDDQIAITFNGPWFQEDIDIISQMILSKFPNTQLKEKILGADRENLRFTCQAGEFILNFDYYSQSCWINAHDEVSTKIVALLYKQLIEGISSNV